MEFLNWISDHPILTVVLLIIVLAFVGRVIEITIMSKPPGKDDQC